VGKLPKKKKHHRPNQKKKKKKNDTKLLGVGSVNCSSRCVGGSWVVAVVFLLVAQRHLEVREFMLRWGGLEGGDPSMWGFCGASRWSLGGGEYGS